MKNILSENKWLVGAFVGVLVTSCTYALTGSISGGQSAQVVDTNIPNVEVTSVTKSTLAMSLQEVMEVLISDGVIDSSRIDNARLFAANLTGELYPNSSSKSILNGGATAELQSVRTALQTGCTQVNPKGGTCVSRGEVLLTGTYTVKITAGNSPVVLMDKTALNNGSYNGDSFTSKAFLYSVPVSNVRVNSRINPLLTTLVGQADKEETTAGYKYTLQPGKSAIVTFVASVDPRQLMAGKYGFGVGDIGSIEFIRPRYIGGLEDVIPLIKSRIQVSVVKNAPPINFVTVVGETSPYISKITPKTDWSFTIEGARLKNTQTATIWCNGAFVETVPAIISNKDWGLVPNSLGTAGVIAIGNFPNGSCQLQLNDPVNGSSNVVNFEHGSPTITISTSTPVSVTAPVVTLSSNSPVSQYVVGSTTATIATFHFVSTSSNAFVNSLMFTIESSTSSVCAINKIIIGGKETDVYRTPKGDCSALVELGNNQINILAGYSGADLPVRVTYNRVGQGAVVSGSNVKLVLENAYPNKAEGEGYMKSKVSSNSMTLVASKPTIYLKPSQNSFLTNGQMTLGYAVVTANAAGSISLSNIPINFSTLKANATNYLVKVNGSVVSGAAYSTYGFVFNQPYKISAGNSAIFEVIATVSNVNPADAGGFVKMTLGPSSNFYWNDLTGGKDLSGVGMADYASQSFGLTY